MWIRILPFNLIRIRIIASKYRLLKKCSNIPYILACHLQIDADSDTDPDSAYHFDADPDPADYFDADPDPPHWLLAWLSSCLSAAKLIFGWFLEVIFIIMFFLEISLQYMIGYQ
jgi:hypothetical protein